MNKTINTTENNKTNLKYNKTIKKEIQNPILNFITESVILASNSINICAILTDTLTGRTARYLSSLRLNIPIHVQCYNDQIKQELNLNYAIIPMCLKKRNNNDYFLKELILELLNAKKLKKTDLVLVVGGSFKSTLSSSFLEIAKVKEIIELFS
jgi:pyruvate kinase